MKHIFLWAFFGIVFCLQSAVLTEKGVSAYVIVVKPEAPRVTRAAASELQEYIRKVTGAALAVAETKPHGKKGLYVGSHPELPGTPEFNQSLFAGKERFRIAELSSGDLSIMGADCDADPYSERGDFGLLFGVYEFIERFLGVRWYAPGSFGECLEQRPTVEIGGLPLEVVPRAWSRSIWPYVWNEFPDRDAPKFASRLRTPGIHDGGANHSMMDLRFFASDQEEIFALDADGKSRNRGTFKPGTRPEDRKWLRYPQYCFSNPATVKAYCDFIDAVYAGRPAGRLWKTRAPNDFAVYVVPDDNFTTQPCYCPECQKQIQPKGGRGAMSPLVWGFVKKVAEYVKVKYPDRKVMCLAYEAYYLPPDFVLPDNVVVQICVNPYLIYHGAQPYRREFDQVLQSWGRKVNSIALWHYLLPYDDIPYSMPHVMYQWFRDYPKVKSVFLELNDTGLRPANLPSFEKRRARRVNDLPQSHLNIYFALKSLAGCELDVDQELEIYYRLFYGPAARPMKAFYEAIHGAWEHVPDHCTSVAGSYRKFSGKAVYDTIYSPAVLKKLNQSFAEARKLTADGSLYRRRLDWLEQGYFAKFRLAAGAFAAEGSRSRDLSLAPEIGTAPALNGRLEGKFWEGLDEHSFVRIDAPLPPRFATSFRIGLADNHLWLGIRAEDPDDALQLVNAGHHDADVFTDDSIEIFICPQGGTDRKFMNISVNLKAVILDYSAGGGEGLNRRYETGARAAVFRGKGFYTMTVAVPLQGVGLNAGDMFSMNVCRNKYSGVGENHERSAWFCPSGSFWNLKGAPQVRLPGKLDRSLEEFTECPRVILWMQTKPGDRLGPLTKKGVRHEFAKGVLSLFYKFDESNHRYDYGNWTLPLKKGTVKLNGATRIELRFRNPDAGLNHLLTYSYVDADGKVRGDYIRFCTSEAHTDWRVRSFDIARDGYGAGRRARKGEVIAPAVQLNMLKIYSDGRQDGRERRLDLDYIRLVAPRK